MFFGLRGLGMMSRQAQSTPIGERRTTNAGVSPRGRFGTSEKCQRICVNRIALLAAGSAFLVRSMA